MALYFIFVLINIICFCALLMTRHNFAKWLVEYHPETALQIRNKMHEERSLHDKIIHRFFGLPFERQSYESIKDEELENLRRAYIISVVLFETILIFSVLSALIYIYIMGSLS